jgi:hypothetical protein
MAFEIVVAWENFNRLSALHQSESHGGSRFWLDAPEAERELARIGCRDAQGLRAAHAAGTLVMLVPKAGRNPGSVLIQEVTDPE